MPPTLASLFRARARDLNDMNLELTEAGNLTYEFVTFDDSTYALRRAGKNKVSGLEFEQP